MLIEEICELLINELIANGYDDSTIFNYRAFSRRFKEFCEEKEVYEYSSDIGKLYAEAVISKRLVSLASLGVAHKVVLLDY